MKKLFLISFCFVMILSVVFSKPLDAQSSNISDKEDEKYINEVAEVTQKYMTVQDDIVQYNITKMEKALKDNPYGKDAVATAKKFNNTNFNDTVQSIDRSNNNFTTYTASNSRCALLGKKDNTKYWNSLNSCLDKKIRNLFSLPNISSASAAAIIDHILDGEIKKATGKLSKFGGKLASKGSAIVTLTTMYFTCMNSAQKKYPPGGCI